MNHLIVLAHGSRNPASNDEVCRLADSLNSQLSDRYSSVRAAFQEIAAPSLVEAVENAIEAGAGTITLFPYFLVAGKHVSRDLPEQIDELKQQFPQLTITCLPYLGAMADLDQFIAKALS